MQEPMKDQVTSFYIFNSFFENNQASSSGGAVSVDNLKNISFFNNTFQGNQAQQNGGAIYHICTSSIFDCTFELKGNDFQDNSVKVAGGAIYWRDVQPMDMDNSFTNNSAAVYGSNFAHFAVALKMMSQERRLNEDSFVGQRSGGEISDFKIGLVDVYDQIVATDDSSSLVVQVKGTYSNSKFAPVIEGVSQYYVKGGEYLISKLIFVGTPGDIYTLTFQTNGIDENKPMVRERKE